MQEWIFLYKKVNSSFAVCYSICIIINVFIIVNSVLTGAHEQKERATYSADTLIINDVLPLYLGMNVRHIYLTRITR